MTRLRGLFSRYGEMMGDVAWSGLGDGLSLVANMVSFWLLVKTLAPEVYGGYVGFYGIVGPVGALSWSGLGLLVLQKIIKDGEDAQTVTNRALAMTVVQGVIAVGAVTLLSSMIVSTIGLQSMFLMATAELLLFPISNTAFSLIQATHGFAASAKARLALPLVRVGALLVTYSFGTLTIRNLAIAWIIGFTVTAGISVFSILPRYGLAPGFRRPDGDNIRTSLELSTPMAASNLQTNGDKAIMNAYNMEIDAGAYGAAYRIVLLSQFPIQTMNKALFQRFLPGGDGRKGLHLERAKRFATTSLALSLVIAAGMALFAEFAISLIGADDVIDPSIVRWLLPLIPLLAISRAPLNGLMGLGLNSPRAYLIVSSAALSMVLYLALIPSFSWRGAVVGTILAEIYLAIGGWVMLIRAQRRADGAPGNDDPDEPSEPRGSWRVERVIERSV